MATAVSPSIEPISNETLAGLQASAAALLGTAAFTLRADGRLKIQPSVVGMFYQAMCVYPAGADWLVAMAARTARKAWERGLPTTGHVNGMAMAAFPLPGDNGAASALVVMTTPGLRPDIRPVVAADLGIPPNALPTSQEPTDTTHTAAALRFLEQSLAVAATERESKNLTDADIRRDRRLYAATKALVGAVDESTVLREASESLAGILHMDRGLPYVRVTHGWEPRGGASFWGEPSADAPALELKPAVEAALLAGDIVHGPHPDHPRGRRTLVPMVFLQRRALESGQSQDVRELDAVIVLETPRATKEASAAEDALAKLVAQQATMALRTARSAALEKSLAVKLQDTLQSHFDAAALPQLHVQEYYRPAAQEARVGGDFYDVFPLPEGRAAVLVGDVAGKGLDAAIHTSLARYTLRAYALTTPDPGEILRLSNEALARFPEFRDFLTVALVILEPGQGQLRFASAGHPPVFMYRKSVDAIGALESTGTLLGMMSGMTWKSETHKWGPGDALLLYTDGISEAHPPGSVDMFETTRIRDLFALHRHAPPKVVVDSIFKAAERFSESIMHDDCAMLLVTQPSD